MHLSREIKSRILYPKLCHVTVSYLFPRNMFKVFRLYSTALTRYPLVTKSLTAGTISAAGDIFCQKVFPVDKKNTKIDINRTIRFTFLGLCVLGPVLHKWYGFLGTNIVGTGIKSAMKRTALDQFVFAPCIISVIISTLSVIQTFQENRSNYICKVKSDLKERYYTTFLMNYVFWTPAQALNFLLIPLQYQVLFNNVVALFWNCYLSYSAASSDHQKLNQREVEVELK